MLKNIISLLVAVTLLVTTVFTQTVSAANADWAAVERLPAGERIRVKLSTGKTLNGTIDHVTEEAVYLRSKDKTLNASRQDVAHLYREKPGNGKKGALIGAAIGAGAGAGTGAAIMERESGFGGAVAGTVAFFASVGAGLGYALGRRGTSVLIYSAPSRSH
jgi:hypothetical protein